MLCGRSQMPWNSNRSSVLRRGGSGTQRQATVTTASESSAGWCGGTTAGQRVGPSPDAGATGRRGPCRCLSGKHTLPFGPEGTKRRGALGRVLAGHAGIPEGEEDLIKGCGQSQGDPQGRGAPRDQQPLASPSPRGPKGMQCYQSPGRAGMGTWLGDCGQWRPS